MICRRCGKHSDLKDIAAVSDGAHYWICDECWKEWKEKYLDKINEMKFPDDNEKVEAIFLEFMREKNPSIYIESNLLLESKILIPLECHTKSYREYYDLDE